MKMTNRIPIKFLDDENAEQNHGRALDDETPEEFFTVELDDDSLSPSVNLENFFDEAENEKASPHGETTEKNLDLYAPPNLELSPNSEKELRAVYEKTRAELYTTRAELRRVETELEKTQSERQTALAEKQSLAEQLARLRADFENFRKRIERERAETYNHLVGDVAAHLLPVMDNLQRAVAAETSIEANESEEFRHFLRGVELIAEQLGGVLDGLGVETVCAVGQQFNPHLHEAVAAEPTSDFAPETVIEEIAVGYRLGDKLLRPAMVKVAARPES
jgi:molecular chaperone GrpE